MKLPVRISCCLCTKVISKEIEIPDGWKISYKNIIEEDLAFCPEHHFVELWREENCPTCKEEWGSCTLWKKFIYGKEKISKESYDEIEEGFCPAKKNKEALLIKNCAIRRAGYRLADAIKEYRKKAKKKG